MILMSGLYCSAIKPRLGCPKAESYPKQLYDSVVTGNIKDLLEVCDAGFF